MDFVDVKLEFLSDIRFDMERWGLSPARVAAVGLRVQAQPFVGAPHPKGYHEFFWRDAQWGDDYRVLYARFEDRDGIVVRMIAIQRVDEVPAGAALWAEARSELEERLKSKAFDVAYQAVVRLFTGGVA